MPQASGNALPVVLRGMFLDDCAHYATSGNALPVVLRGMFLDDCVHYATQDVDTAFGAASRAELG
jgi:hypothetical protein